MFHRWISSVPFKNDGQRPGRPRSYLDEKIVDGIGNIVKVVVEQAPLATGFVAGCDPASSGKMYRANPVHRNPPQESMRVEMEIRRVRVEVVKVQQKVCVGRDKYLRDPSSLIAIRPWRVDERRDVLDQRARSNRPRGAFDVQSCTLDRGGSPRGCGEMPDLDLPGPYEREMLGPRFRSHPIDDATDALKPSGVDRSRRGEPEGDPMHRYRHLRRKRPQSAERRRGRVDEVVGHHLDNLDPVEVREDARSERSTPADANAIALLSHRSHRIPSRTRRPRKSCSRRCRSLI